MKKKFHFKKVTALLLTAVATVGILAGCGGTTKKSSSSKAAYRTVDEIKKEAAKHGYRLQKIPDYDCSCYMPYPNIRHKHRNGKWKCVDRYEPSKHKPKYSCYHMPCTFCNRKTTDTTD